MSVPPFALPSVTSLPRGGRDGFVADTAIRIERLEATIAKLQGELEMARSGLQLLMESADQAQRLRAFEQSLRNSREYKIEEILRTTNELKSRLDHAEGERTAYLNLPYNTWAAVNSKFAGLSETASKSRIHYGAAVALAVLAAVLSAAFGYLRT